MIPTLVGLPHIVVPRARVADYRQSAVRAYLTPGGLVQDIAEDIPHAGAAGDPTGECRVEIRSREPLPPAPTAELDRLGIEILEQSRVLRLWGARPDAPALSVLADPLAEEILPDGCGPDGLQVDVFCGPGVTDTEGEMAARALAEAGLAGVICRAGTRYRLAGAGSLDRQRVERLLGNPLIHEFGWSDLPQSRDERGAASVEETAVEIICLTGCSDAVLLGISRERGLALDLTEMQAIARHFEALGRDPTDVELQSIALAWSEHCCHKTFRAPIELRSPGRTETIPGLLRACLIEPARRLNRRWVRSAFVDNAGIIAFDAAHDLAVKVETHNHPSALEPYGGAHTGVGGVIRDILAVSAEPIANTDVLCFGPPDLPDEVLPAGTIHPRATLEGVVRGVADYGNNMGIPTVAGAVIFHPGYTANPLVYCGTLGMAPRDSHPRDPQPGDLVVLLGGRTGRDGLNGATMSSAQLDRATVAGSTVQIGAPIVEKTVRDVLPHLRDERLYHAITDCGAGGLCSAVGEMGERLGVEVDLDRVPLKYQGLAPWEIWLSEAQERMVLAVDPAALSRLLELCRAHGVDATPIGHFRQDGVLLLRHRGQEVGRLETAFLHGGWPARTLEARWEPVTPSARPGDNVPDPAAALLALLAHPSIASKEHIIRRYDHEVQAGTVLKPLTADGGPSDGTVLQPLAGSRRGVAVGHGINPLYGADPHAMALLAVDEALRNLVAAGCSIDRTVLLDNFCWGDVDDPWELGRLVRAAQGCKDATELYRVPFISGKDSLRNTSVSATGRNSIPGTLLITAVGIVPDAGQAVSMDLKEPGNRVYLLGLTREELGGSHHRLIQGIEGGSIPAVRPGESPRLMRRLTRVMRRGLVRSCHDLSEGGLAVAAAEMAIGGGLGLELDLTAVPRDCDALESLLFAESPGRFLVEVKEENAPAFEALFDGLPAACIGRVTAEPRLVLRRGVPVLDLSVESLAGAWRGALPPCPMLSGSPHPPAPSPTTAGRTEFGDPLGREGEKVTASWHLHAQQLPSRHTSIPPLPRRERGVGGEGTPPPSGSGRATALDYRGLRKGSGGEGTTTVRAMVLAAPGINCDRETLSACELAGARAESVHLNELLDGRRRLDEFGFLILPGGFSYGDHLGAGAMLATILRHRLMDDLLRFVEDGRPVLGICNGFQVLARLGLLGDVTLLGNSSRHFECRWVPLRVEGAASLFLRGLEELELPVAHGQGRLVTQEPLPELLARAPLRYCRNPNGSVADIAGVSNAAGTVFGLMPHPERFISPLHHPRWIQGSGREPAGLAIFRNAVEWVAGA